MEQLQLKKKQWLLVEVVIGQRKSHFWYYIFYIIIKLFEELIRRYGNLTPPQPRLSIQHWAIITEPELPYLSSTLDSAKNKNMATARIQQLKDEVLL